MAATRHRPGNDDGNGRLGTGTRLRGMLVGTEPENAPARTLYARYAEPTDCVLYSWELDSPSG